MNTSLTDRKALDDLQVVSTSFPYAGANIWHPFGFRAANNLVMLAGDLLEPLGYSEIGLPSLIPAEFLERQASEIKDFRERVYFADTPKSDAFVVKSTIEAQISAFMGASPPMDRQRFYTRRSIARYESGKTSPLWIDRIIWPFFEAHATVPRDEVDLEIETLIAFTVSLAGKLNLPIVHLERMLTANARHLTYAHRRLEAVHVMPTGQVTTLTSIYDLGDRFSQMFGVVNPEGQIPSMVNFGFSGRMLLALLTFLRQHIGWAWPHAIAPAHLAIVARPEMATTVRRIQVEFQALNLTTHVMLISRVNSALSQTVGMGLPVALLITGSEENPRFSLVTYDNARGTPINTGYILQATQNLISECAESARQLCQEHDMNFLKAVLTLDELHDRLLQDRVGWASLCANPSCLEEVAVISSVYGVSLLGRRVDYKLVESTCLICGRQAVQTGLLAKRFGREK